MIRCSREPKRSCSCCGTRTLVLTLALGAELLRICDACFDKIVRAKSRLVVERLDSIEVGP